MERWIHSRRARSKAIVGATACSSPHSVEVFAATNIEAKTAVSATVETEADAVSLRGGSWFLLPT